MWQCNMQAVQPHVYVCVLHTKVISAAKAIKFERQVALLEARIVSLPVVTG